MHKTSLAALALLPALLAGCSQIARSAADNREVSALPLQGQDFGGRLHAGAPAQGAGLGRQALAYSATLTLTGRLDDLDLSSLPGIVGQPSGLDIPLAFASADFSACGTSAPSINVTVKGATLFISDAGHPDGASVSRTNLNIPLTLTRSADRYSVTFGNSPGAVFLTLFAPWSQFAPIAVRSGGNTPNSFAASVDITTDQGADNCPVKFRTPDQLAQRVRFQ